MLATAVDKEKLVKGLELSDDGKIKGDQSRFIDNITGLKGDHDGPNFTKHEGLEDHCFFAIMRHA